MQDLIKRIEAAEGPSMELDVEIALANGWVRREYSSNWFYPPSVPALHHESELPNYTSSIDEAMTLVPDGWIVKAYITSSLVPHTFVVSEGVGIGGVVGYSDHSMALALCAAALRARQEV